MCSMEVGTRKTSVLVIRPTHTHSLPQLVAALTMIIILFSWMQGTKILTPFQ